MMSYAISRLAYFAAKALRNFAITVIFKKKNMCKINYGTNCTLELIKESDKKNIKVI